MKDMVEQQNKGPLAWFAGNHVASNLLMFLLIAAGIMTVLTIKVEFFPEMSLDMVTVTVPYRGASPAEVEQGVTLRVEEAVASVDGIKHINSASAEGACVVTLELEEYADVSEVLDDVKAEVDRIITFPQETEKPIISEVKSRYEVLSIVLHGDASERSLKELAEGIKEDLTALPNISQVEVTGVRPYEISIEVSEGALRKYSLSFSDVTGAVRNTSLDMPGGAVKTVGGEILIRTKGQMYTGSEFEKIVVLTRSDGTSIRLGDIATVIDGFADTDTATRFDGQRASQVKVYRVGQQSALDVADTIKRYIEQKRTSLPKGISLDIWEDMSQVLRARIGLLRRNGCYGLILVFLCLTLFLDIRLAFWTTMGIPISFLGAFWFMPLFGISLNMISLFAFIMVLGIVVDDAIVVGENIYQYRGRGLGRLESAVKGVREMSSPVTMAVLTTIFAFVPLMYISGIMGKILRVIPMVVIMVLFVSLIEALLILPAHLTGGNIRRKRSNIRTKSGHKSPLGRFHAAIARWLDVFVNGPFAGIAMFATKYRYATLAISLAVLMTTFGVIRGGFIKFTFMDSVEADNMVATLTMPQGTPPQQTSEILKRLERAAMQVKSEFDPAEPDAPSIFKHMATTIGAHPSSRGHGPGSTSGGGTSSGHMGEVNIELLGGEYRDISSTKLMNRWRQLVGEVPGVSSLTFMSEIFSAGDAVNVELSHANMDKLIAAAEDLKNSLRDYSGTSDIADSFEPGKAEIKLSITDAGRTLGLTMGELARQVRQGFYGDEAQRIQRGTHDVRVMVRYPLSQRRSLADVERMRIRMPNGAEIPFKTVADVHHGQGYATIRRADRRRVVNVTADVDEAVANASDINSNLAEQLLPDLMARHPGLKYRFAGEQRQRQDSFGSLRSTFPLALLAIYGLLAIQFRSYVQPLIVMSAIPFGIVGATIGHILLGFNLGLLSLFGIVALSGVVVNDSLIMIDLINRERQSGIELHQVVRDSITRRFRPIMLTTLTTFFGLVPMMLERSLQARFLIPMAISLAFGVAFATMITLILVPSLYMIFEDIKDVIWSVFDLESADEKIEPTPPN